MLGYRKRIDENTICVGAVIIGTTFTGQMDPVEDINQLLLNIKQEKVGIFLYMLMLLVEVLLHHFQIRS